MEDIPPKQMNFVAAVWYAEWAAVSNGQAPKKRQRRKWLESVRRAVPSCFCRRTGWTDFLEEVQTGYLAKTIQCSSPSPPIVSASACGPGHRVSQCAVAGRDGALQAEIERESSAVRERFADASAIRALPEVVAFQELLRQVGVNPRREQPSVEKLLNFALKRGDLPGDQ